MLLQKANIFQVYYIVFGRVFILSFPPRPKRNMFERKKETVSITTFKKWLFTNDFLELKSVMGKFSLFYANIALVSF